MLAAFTAMNFYPFKKTRKSVDDPGDRIERYLSDRIKRVMIGINLADDLSALGGALLITAGQGKYLRLLHFEALSQELPESLQDSLKTLRDAPEPGLIPLAESASDLAEAQAMLADQLKRKAGKFIDRVLAISVYDPGIVREDFDGRPVYRSYSDPSRLADLTGLSVIDRFQERDLLRKGSGQMLLGLPYWLMFADRGPTIATTTRLLLVADQDLELWLLPSSDGSDQQLPEVRFLGSSMGGVGGSESLANRLEGLEAAWKQAQVELDRWTWDRNAMEVLVVAKADCQELVLNGDWETLEIRPECVVDKSDSFGDTQILRAVAAGLLGVLHIDQSPANLPFLTGADTQRILGTITAGVPANYRQLLRCMADFSPPAMKLRDAV